jgi:hypothetical protein
MMTDYRLSKLFFDLQQPELRAQYKADRRALIARYGIGADASRALMADDVAALAPRVNPYLLRYYFSYIGMPEDRFIAHLRASAGAQKERQA